IACDLKTSKAVLAVLGLGLFPTVFALLGVLWKDVIMGGSLTLFVGMVLVGVRRRSLAVLLGSLVPLICATAARVNALAAIPPLAAWFIVSAYAAAGRPIPKLRTIALLTVVFSVGSYGLAQLVNRTVATTGQTGGSVRLLQFSMLHDLAGIAIKSG